MVLIVLCICRSILFCVLCLLGGCFGFPVGCCVVYGSLVSLVWFWWCVCFWFWFVGVLGIWDLAGCCVGGCFYLWLGFVAGGCAVCMLF